MKPSFRRRTLVSGILIAVIALGLGGLMIYGSFNRIIRGQFDRTLANRQLQVVAALEGSPGAHLSLAASLPDPAYDRPFSGLYWQVTGPDGAMQTSRSLFDGTLPPPATPKPGQSFYDAEGPLGAVRIVAGDYTLPDGSVWRVEVAQSLEALLGDQKAARDSLLWALALIGIIAIVGTFGQTLAILRDLGKLRSDVLMRWRSDGVIEADRYPVEVRPLIQDINELLHRNRDIIDRTRRQGADLAHALKTPSSILRNEMHLWKASGVDVSMAEAALDRIDGQIRRALARVQMVRSAEAAQMRSPVAVSVTRLTRLFTSIPRDREIEISSSVPPHVEVAMDAVDLEEALGNLVDNACKWAQERVHVSTADFGKRVQIVIEDDGPGIPEARLQEALQPGARLDTTSAGTGLGLAITADLVSIYGGEIALSRAPTLGGLRVTVELPA
ncbi:MAG: sensor histidine kinase N-terminal domain-containing protein [Paracoccaceae bacterium]|nr:sensor histidine kinase N-terminal domain-containing protein [Paracoccaceae bacterium]MDE3122511.1 sensor histidine kinase N-terminal domain-containing protein [Paracoccaceae bacterium]MDE3238067.1 sensor histidine kinase N-terminal domain-containing protein [Paracoccaceae bacterium]